MIEIKTANSTEIKEIATLQANALLGTDYAPVKPEVMNLFVNEMRRRCEKLLNKNSDILVLKDANKTIGYTIYARFENMVEIKNLYVDINQRRKGLGKKLFEAIVQHAKQDNLQYVVTWIIEDNEILKAFYSRLGFKASHMSRMEQLSNDIEIREFYYQFALMS